MGLTLLDRVGLVVALYPMLVALLWCGLALLWSCRREWSERWLSDPPEGQIGPPVSVLIPCFNEGPRLQETLQAALALHWSDWEVIAINDGSSDDTGAQLEVMARRHPRLRVVHLASNQGKALALRAGALLARHELLLCIDADALLDPRAVGWMVRHFQRDPQLAAVAGNPRIRNRSTLLGRLQVGEFSMIVGLIKRAQSQLGCLFCVPGVIGCFRRSALQAVHDWDPTRLTEDIDLTWRLQRAGWRVAFEPHALVWILMPETIGGLWRQRLRWARGGLQVLHANLDLLVTPREWRQLPLVLEPILSLLWLHALLLLPLLQLLAWFQGVRGGPLSLGLPQGLTLDLLLVCGLQVVVSFWLDRPYDSGLRRIGFWMIWFPAAYWVLSAGVSLQALWSWPAPSTPQRARWLSPDRGLPG